MLNYRTSNKRQQESTLELQEGNKVRRLPTHRHRRLVGSCHVVDVFPACGGIFEMQRYTNPGGSPYCGYASLLSFSLPSLVQASWEAVQWHRRGGSRPVSHSTQCSAGELCKSRETSTLASFHVPGTLSPVPCRVCAWVFSSLLLFLLFSPEFIWTSAFPPTHTHTLGTFILMRACKDSAPG